MPSRRAPCSQQPPSHIRVDTAAGPVEVAVRRSARARRLALRATPGGDGVELVLPHGAAWRDGAAFARANARWIGRAASRTAPSVAFAHGAEIPYLGVMRRIVHRPPPAPPGPHGAAIAWADGDAIHVRGETAFLARRLTGWLRARARDALAAAVMDKARRIDKKPARVRIGDARSRWGSCGANRALNFSWRLILAPPPALDYVAAHETAHLAHMNHTRAFWACCADLLGPAPRFDGRAWDVETCRAWLRVYGQDLHRYG